jgi:hypothetical protein
MNREETQSQCISLHHTLAKLKGIRHYFFLSGLILWTIFPLYGIILLLIYCQINISIQGTSHKSIFLENIIPLIIFLFTITVFMSSFNSFGDTDIYIGVYKDASNQSSLLDYMNNIWIKDSLEPLTFALPMYISLLTDGNSSWFLLFQSLTINTAFTIYSILFLPEVYPIVILINILSRGYYYQLFLMRQAYSFIFIIPWLYVDVFYCRLPLIYLAIMSHVSSILYVFTLIIDTIYSQIRDKFTIFKSRLVLIFSLIFFGFNVYYIWLFSQNILLSLLTYINVDKFERINTYSEVLSTSFYDSILYQIYTFGIDSVVLSIFVFNTDATKIPSSLQKYFVRWRSLFYVMIFVYLICNFIGFNPRIYYIFSSLTGFFYTIPFYSGNLVKKGNNIYVNIILGLMFFKIISFIGDTIRYKGINNYIYFWDGTSLNKTIIEYLYFLHSIIYS